MARAMQVLGAILSRTMLLSIEVAVEYWLSLTWSPQAQWLSDSAHESPLRVEVRQLSAHGYLWLLVHYSILQGRPLRISFCRHRAYHCTTKRLYIQPASCDALGAPLFGCAVVRPLPAGPGPQGPACLYSAKQGNLLSRI